VFKTITLDHSNPRPLKYYIFTKFLQIFNMKKNKNLIKPQNYTEDAELFNLGGIIIRSFCGSTAESRNCFHIPVIRYILPLDPAIKSQDD